mmetsp:Transcript_4422/g.7393  ORF Transcript_4422/g.7393 Transcript_4422/m.7393 type:complete len:311 (-) Transcript_4422:360-1292(-)
MKLLTHNYKMAEYYVAQNKGSHSIIQKYYDMVLRFSSITCIGEYHLEQMATNTCDPLPNKANVQHTAKLYYEFSDPKIAIAVFRIIFNGCYPFMCRIMNYQAVSFKLTAEQMNIQMSSKVMQMEMKILELETERQQLQQEIDAKRNELRVEDGNACIVPHHDLIEITKHIAQWMMLCKGKFVNLTEANERGTGKTVMEQSGVDESKLKGITLWHNIAHYLNALELGVLIKTEMPGYSWIFRKATLPSNVADLSNKHAVALATLHISLCKYNESYNHEQQWYAKAAKLKKLQSKGEEFANDGYKTQVKESH